MAATYARTVATGPVSLRAGTVWRSAAAWLVFRAGGAPPRPAWRSAITWLAAAGGGQPQHRGPARPAPRRRLRRCYQFVQTHRRERARRTEGRVILADQRLRV